MESHKQTKLAQEKNFNSHRSIKEIDFIIKDLPTNKTNTPSSKSVLVNSRFKEEMITSQTLPAKRVRRNSVQLNLWSQNYLEPKAKKRHHEKGEDKQISLMN